MFSRSDKSDELTDELFESEPKASRSPMVLAAVAGLLAIAGAFLLVRYLSDNNSEAASAEAAAAAATEPILVVTTEIPKGTAIQDIVDSPGTYLRARRVEAEYVAPGAIGSIEELRALANAEDSGALALDSALLVGDQLVRGRFVDLADFDNDAFIDRSAAIPVPAAHHTVVLDLPAERMLGGNVRPGDEVAVVGAFTVRSATEGTAQEVSVVVLPVVEVINVETNAEVIGEISADRDELGRSTVGAFRVTLAIEGHELTDLTFAIEYGEIIIATSLPDAEPTDPRPFSTIDTIINGAEFNDEDLAELLGLIAEEREEAEANGDADSDDADSDAADDAGDAGTDDAGDTGDTGDAAPADEGDAAPASDEGEATGGGSQGAPVPPSDPNASGTPDPPSAGERVDQPVDDAIENPGALAPGEDN